MLDRPEALAVALVARLLFTLADVLAAAVVDAGAGRIAVTSPGDSRAGRVPPGYRPRISYDESPLLFHAVAWALADQAGSPFFPPPEVVAEVRQFGLAA